MGVIRKTLVRSWFALDSLHAPTLMSTDVQTHFLGTHLLPLNIFVSYSRYVYIIVYICYIYIYICIYSILLSYSKCYSISCYVTKPVLLYYYYYYFYNNNNNKEGQASSLLLLLLFL